MADAADAPAAAAAAAAPAVPAPMMDAPKNDFLVVCDTSDKWSTAAALGKELLKARRNGRMEVGDVDIEIPEGQGMPKHNDILPGLQRIGKNPKSAKAFFSFISAEAQANGLEALGGAKVKGKQWKAWVGNENHANYYNFVHNEKSERGKRKLGEGDDGPDAKRSKAASIHDFVEPLHQTPYPEQLQKKTANLDKIIADIKSTMNGVWAGKQKPAALEDPLATFHGVVPSPTQDGYRNKVEFTIGVGKDGKTPVVGFMFGRTSESLGWIEPPTDVKVISDRTKSVVTKFSDYLKTTPHAVYDKFQKRGVWRTLLVREGMARDATERNAQPTSLLVDVQIAAAKDSDVYNAIAADIQRLFKTASEEASDAVDADAVVVESLSLTENKSLNNFCEESAPTKILKGSVEIEDRALGKRFRVSARSFFQVNSLGNEVLLNEIAKFAGLNKDSLLVDLCCGTGTIGISLADRVKNVIGIDCVASAIDDARENAAKNGITNAEYHCGKAEDLVHSVLGPHEDNPNLIAIVDPPRCGLHGKVLEFLRNCSGLNRFVYVSCKQSSLVQNCEKLTQPCSKKIYGAPFKPVEAVGVDLFPHCDMQEMIVLFERVKDEAPKAAA